MNDIIFAAINLGIAVAFFVLGKYVYPKIPKTITDKLFELGQMAEKFVVWAREFMKSSTGAEKMEKVVEMLKEVAEEAGLKVTDEQLQAIVQAAYEAMKAGEKEAQQAAPAASVVINTRPRQEPWQFPQMMCRKMHWKTMQMERSMHMTNRGKRWEPLQKRWRNRLPQTSL